LRRTALTALFAARGPWVRAWASRYRRCFGGRRHHSSQSMNAAAAGFARTIFGAAIGSIVPMPVGQAQKSRTIILVREALDSFVGSESGV